MCRGGRLTQRPTRPRPRRAGPLSPHTTLACPSSHPQTVLNRPSPEHRQEDAEFEPNEVYAIDIVVSTGENFTL